MANDIERLARSLNDMINAATVAGMIALPLGVLMFVTECRKQQMDHQPPAAAPLVPNDHVQSAAAQDASVQN